MNTARRNADQDIARLQFFARNQVLSVAGADREAREVIFVLGHESRVLRGLTADQRAARLNAALRDTGDNRRNLLRNILAAGNVVEEKERLAARAGDIVHAHRDTVNADGIVAIQQKRNF